MKENINLVELLKDCPKGMELYSPLCGECKLYDVNDYNIRIETSNKDTLICLYHDGRYCANGEIMLFPKGKTTWEGFVPPCKFKVGDVIQYIDTYKVKITEVNIEDGCYEYESIIAKGIGSIGFSEQDNWELVPNKFDINTLKPFESRVLMRSSNAREWVGTFYSHYSAHNNKFYGCGMCCDQCIPYEGNEHFLGTTKDCDDYYKTW